MEFQGQLVVVTGAGQGIGRAVAEGFARTRARVVVWDRDAAAADHVVAGIHARGELAEVAVADVTQSQMVKATVESIQATHGPISVLVNNVGGGHATAGIEISEEDWEASLAYNLKSTFLVTRAVWPAMARAGAGVVINTASLGASVPQPGLLAYCTAKAGVVMLTKMLALEGAPLGIRVNCVSPGYVMTPTAEAHFARQPDPARAIADGHAVAALGRMGEPRDVVGAYVYLASTTAGWVTGTELHVDGGV